MLRRFLLTLLALLLLLIADLVSLLPLLLVRSRLEGPTFLLALCLWAALAMLSALPVFSMLLKKIWFFRGTGEPASLEQVRERLLAINGMDCPVTVSSRRKKLILTWRYQEKVWCELFSRLDITRLYELHCRFDPATRTVVLTDRMRTADFLICPERIKIGFSRIPLPCLGVRPGRLGTVEQYAALAAHEYDFRPREIKSPVMGTILACGWNVRFSLF
jgi:hypothetical protein